MKPSDRNKIVFDDIEHHLAKTTNQIMNWISVHKPLISHSIKETDRLSKFNSDLLPCSTVLTRSACKYIISLPHFCGPGARVELSSLKWQPQQR